jgi:hypothetical protein
MTPIAELSLDLLDSSEKVRVRLFAPVHRPESSDWVCRFEIDGEIQHAMDIVGESSVQAIALALKGLSSDLYGSEAYRQGRLGAAGDFGGYLHLPAPHIFLDEAPYPF